MTADGSPPRITTDGRLGQVDATVVPRYAGRATLARLPTPDEVSDLDIAIVGVPFDSGGSYRPGARFGPNHIRESSRLLRPYNPSLGVAASGAPADNHVIPTGRPTPYDSASTLSDDVVRSPARSL